MANHPSHSSARTLQERFDESYRVDPATGCWNWTKALGSNGYGRLRVGSRMVSAHRLSWELHNGPIPEGAGYHGTCTLHQCDNRPCVNPAHLFLGTTAANMADRCNKGRQAKGRRNGRAKSTDAQVLEIRSRQGQLQRELAKEFGLGQSQVSAIRLGKRWAHLGAA